MKTIRRRREYTIDEIENTMVFYGYVHIEQAILKLDQLIPLETVTVTDEN